MKHMKLEAVSNKPARNPLYQKIGKRIRQARLMAKESNSRDLSIRLGWSAGRINNYESGLSTPGVDETLQFCAALKVDPGWITYGIGSPRPAELHSIRYRKFIDALDDAEKKGNLPDYLAAIKLSSERMQKFRRKPYTKIPDVMARRCEKYLGRHRGWIDEDPGGLALPADLSEEMRDLLALYSRLTPEDKKKLYSIGEVLVG